MKVDPDCVFMPGKLQGQLASRSFNVNSPIYLLNCDQWYAIQGPLEVFSKAGSQKFFEGLPNCKAWVDWQTWGEDWFVGKCMEILGIRHEELKKIKKRKELKINILKFFNFSKFDKSFNIF